jgi:MoxR-like ATPase
VADLAVSVLAHRVLPSTEAQLARRSVSEIITKAVQSAPVPDKR